jgi:hypothetical protein
VIYALLTCSDDACEATYEGWGELEELESIACELCGCALQAVAFTEAGRSSRSSRSPDIQLRDAA